MASPMPRAAPVTIAVFLSSDTSASRAYRLGHGHGAGAAAPPWVQAWVRRVTPRMSSQ
jgi:hypothetical protein